MKKNYLIIICSVLFICMVSAQEVLKSTEEEYYDYLSIQGLTNRPTLNYRTLSDSVWNIIPLKTNNTEQATENITVTKENVIDHVWNQNNLGTNRIINNNNKLSWKIYGPQWYNSFNTAAPYGQNDGALWQGKGYNTSLTAGVRFEAYGLALTLKPQLCFSQNLAFNIMPSNTDSPYGYFWGYSHNVGVDAPQRFGDDPFWTFDWGDTEIRYSWKTLTVGFGTQAIWLGPAWLNPMLHSNNAPTYPKIDIGLRRQSVTLPWLNWYIGDIEARMWVGRLTESEYFDNDDSNDHNLYNGFSIAYAPSFLPGFTLSAAKVCLSKWNDSSWKYLNPLYDNNEAEDQKASISADWILPSAGVEVYGELGIDDYVPNKLKGMIRYPFHTMIYTVGLKKAITISKENQLHGELLFEWNNTEMSQDFQLQWTYNFGFHNIITQGYTNRGQWLGSGIGYGGNSQYLGFKLYYPKGTSLIFVGRNNPDNNYIYSKSVYASAADDDHELEKKYFVAFKANFFFGVQSSWYVTHDFFLSGSVVYNMIINPLYDPQLATNGKYCNNQYIDNFQFSVLLKYIL